MIYFVFLITFTFAVQYSRDPTYSFYYNEYMKDKILYEEFPTSQVPLTFYDVATADDFWDYMKVCVCVCVCVCVFVCVCVCVFCVN